MTTPVKFLRLPEVRDRVGLSRSQIYRLIQAGEFPAPIKLGARVSVWPDRDIHTWQQEILNQSGRGVSSPADSSNS